MSTSPATVAGPVSEASSISSDSLKTRAESRDAMCPGTQHYTGDVNLRVRALEGRHGTICAGKVARAGNTRSAHAGTEGNQQRPASHADRLGTRAGMAAGRAAHRRDEVEIAVNYGGDTACGTKGVIGRLGRLVTSTQSYRTSPVPYRTCGGRKTGPRATGRPPRAV